MIYEEIESLNLALEAHMIHKFGKIELLLQLVEHNAAAVYASNGPTFFKITKAVFGLLKRING